MIRARLVAIYCKREGRNLVDAIGRVICVITEEGEKICKMIPENTEMAMCFDKRNKRGELEEELTNANKGIEDAIAHKDWVLKQITQLQREGRLPESSHPDEG